MVYEGAIYLHEGQQYEVMRLDWDGRLATVKPVQVDYYTEATQSVDIRVLDTFEQSEAGGVVKARGEVRVTTAPTGYKKIKLYTHETLGYGEIRLPEQEIHTTAYWLSFDEAMVERLRAADRTGPRSESWPGGGTARVAATAARRSGRGSSTTSITSGRSSRSTTSLAKTTTTWPRTS